MLPMVSDGACSRTSCPVTGLSQNLKVSRSQVSGESGASGPEGRGMGNTVLVAAMDGDTIRDDKWKRLTEWKILATAGSTLGMLLRDVISEYLQHTLSTP